MGYFNMPAYNYKDILKKVCRISSECGRLSLWHIFHITKHREDSKLNNPKLKYLFYMLLNVVSFVLPFAAGMWMINNYANGGDKKMSLYVFTAALLQFLIFRGILKRKLHEAIQDNEYDEFGVSKKRNYDNLSRAEREAMDVQKTAQMESLLSSSVVKRITKKGSKNPEDDLNALIGMSSVKQKVNEMSARMKFEKETKKKKSSSEGGRHMIFYGSAGTGKTTVARIITGFLYKYGYIKENKCIEIDGNFLKAGEESATKTRMIIQRAYGGVLFIDEAYTIIDGSGGYGREAVATLIKEMEDNRDRLIIILAGYRGDMKRLLDSNEGFRSRIKEYVNFPDYTVPEMKEIFTAMANERGYAVSAEALENFEIRCTKEKKLSSFGNGRTVRNILDEAVDRHAYNYGRGVLKRTVTENGVTKVIDGAKENKFILCGCDVSTEASRDTL